MKDVRPTDLTIETVPLDLLTPYAGNAKKHPRKQVEQIANSIREFGNCDPIAVWTNRRGELEIVEGHGRLYALDMLGVKEVPVISLDHLSDEQRRAYTHIHNQLTMNSGWDNEVLSAELDDLRDDFDMESFGFDFGYDSDEGYTDLVKGLIYEPSEIQPRLSELVETEERDGLENYINSVIDISQAERAFLLEAAERFLKFDYAAIADYYAGASKPMREAMRRLKLVIVDEGSAIENAAVEFASEVEKGWNDAE